MESHVYILAHKSEPIIKIGKANSISARAAAFGLDVIDFDRSLGILVGSNAAALRLERILHLTFDDWRVTQNDALMAHGVAYSGSTEWFLSECRERLEAFINSNKEFYGLTTIPGVDLICKPSMQPDVGDYQPTENSHPSAKHISTKEQRLEARRIRTEGALLELNHAATQVASKFNSIIARSIEEDRIISVGISEYGNQIALRLRSCREWMPGNELFMLNLDSPLGGMCIAGSHARWTLSNGEQCESVCLNILASGSQEGGIVASTLYSLIEPAIELLRHMLIDSSHHQSCNYGPDNYSPAGNQIVIEPPAPGCM